MGCLTRSVRRRGDCFEVGLRAVSSIEGGQGCTGQGGKHTGGTRLSRPSPRRRPYLVGVRPPVGRDKRDPPRLAPS